MQHGYGLIHVRVDGKRRLLKAHRLIYEDATGETPETVDHLCHDNATCDGGDDCPHRRCCNPAHLGPESRGGNSYRAQTGKRLRHCRSGRHEMTEDNIYFDSNGQRYCRACRDERLAGYRDEYRQQRGPISRTYRPRGLGLHDLVEWATEHNEDPDACWSWRDGNPSDTGHVLVSFGGTTTTAHRLVYEALVGPVERGKVIDHRCHDPRKCEGGPRCPHRACCNPRHLKVVTRAVNSSAERSAAGRAAVVCVAGLHEMTPDNVYVAPKTGKRLCVKCARQAQRDARAAKDTGPDRRFRQDGRCVNDHEVPAGEKCRECARARNARWRAKR
jgi:hypothetical protein